MSPAFTDRLNIHFVLGTAAELIKVYPLIQLARQRGHAVRVLATGQSRENFLMQYNDLRLPADGLTLLLEQSQDLDKASSAGRWFWRALTVRSGAFRRKLGLAEAGTNWLVVHGDTLSTLVGAWLGWRNGLRVVHVEAGLRSPSLFSPFPEEITRRLVSRFVDIHMAPDAFAAENLLRHHSRRNVVTTNGNSLKDAVHLAAQFAPPASPRAPFALVNIHRFENLNSRDRWENILQTVVRAANQIQLIFVTHPQTRHKLEIDPAARDLLVSARIEIRERMPFSEFISLLKRSEFLITDGGSNQEECSYLGKPCLILREATERHEGLTTCCVLSRFDPAKIDAFLTNPKSYERPAVTDDVSPSRLMLNFLETQG